MENSKEKYKKTEEQEQSPYDELYGKKEEESNGKHVNSDIEDAGEFGSAAKEPGASSEEANKNK